MSTEAQINANRTNAQKSTGPKTTAGKAVVAQNAVKHGLFAAENVINCENQADFDHFCDEILAELAPVGAIESMLAARIVGLSWRLKRAERMHNEAIDVMIAKEETDPWQKTLRERAGKAQDPRAGGLELILGWATKNDFSDSRVLERLMMYERRIEYSLFKTMNELQKRQLMRELEASEAVESEPAIPIPISNNRDEAATRSAEKGKNEKQTQFPLALMGVKGFTEKDYESRPHPALPEDKPNLLSSPQRTLSSPSKKVSGIAK